MLSRIRTILRKDQRSLIEDVPNLFLWVGAAALVLGKHMKTFTAHLVFGSFVLLDAILIRVAVIFWSIFPDIWFAISQGFLAEGRLFIYESFHDIRYFLGAVFLRGSRSHHHHQGSHHQQDERELYQIILELNLVKAFLLRNE